MTEPQRLFDCLDRLLTINPDGELLVSREGGRWVNRSPAMVHETVFRLAAGLLQAGIGGGDGSIEGKAKVAVLSRNCPEWVMLDLAVQLCGAVLVPVYPTISINELEFIFNDAQIRLAFVYDDENLQKVTAIRSRVPSLQDIYTLGNAAGAKSWKQLLVQQPELIEKVRAISSSIRETDLATIIYTSGTTGKPKGVMLSHQNIMSNVRACVPCLPVRELRALSFLPLNHIFERMITYFYLYKNASVFYAESLDTIADNLREVKPDMFTTVPRLLEKVYDRIMAKGAELKGIKRKLFYWAHDLATRYEINTHQGWWYRMQLGLANRLVFSKWRAALGNNILCIVSGGAACQVRLIRIFTAAGIPVMEGYGLTETSPVISVNRFEEADRMFGTVGPGIDSVDIKLAEDGEILCKGPGVMLGYYRHPELTAEVIDDGWFHTGDIGTIVNNRFLKITDRKKEMFKTSGGKYVAPLPIENKLKESVYIEQAMVVGAERKFVGALIVPSFPNLTAWAKQQGITVLDHEALIREPKVIAFYAELVESFNKFFSHVEQIKRFELLASEWTVDGGELTPKLSLKRKIVMEKNASAIERIYQ